MTQWADDDFVIDEPLYYQKLNELRNQLLFEIAELEMESR